MKYIEKGEEPESFTVWKASENEDWKPHWDDFRSPQKSKVHEALIQEQGYLCCYCGLRIDRNSSHIEHLKPRAHYPKLALEYSNLLASCPGEGDDQDQKQSQELLTKAEHCGPWKKDWYDADLMVSPMTKNCADYFIYTGFGEILPTDDPTMQVAANATIERLGLNNAKLEASRRRALQAILPILEGLSIDEMKKLAQAYSQKDAEGKYVRFCTAIISFLERYSTPEASA